jgi:non-ribosomal peptide synthase protein (TIGR01720 family)
MTQLVWFRAAPHVSGELLIVVHHLAVDGVSWRILLPDLQAAWEAEQSGSTPALATAATSFRRWAHALAEEATQPHRVAELAYWRDVCRDAVPLVDGRLDARRDSIGTAGRWRHTVPETVAQRLLTQVPAAFHAGINDVLLAALAIAVRRWLRQRGRPAGVPLVTLEGHGRAQLSDGIDLTRTVGWFTSCHPLRLDIGGVDVDDAWSGGPALGEAVKTMKEQLRRVPGDGLGFGLLRYLNPATASALEDLPEPQLGFNYLGRFGDGPAAAGDWRLVPSRGIGGDGDPSTPLTHAIEVNAMTVEGARGPVLTAHWMWAPALIPATAARELASGWTHVLEQLVNHFASASAGGLTPSDVALAGLSRSEIERIERQYRPGRPTAAR